MFLGACAEDVLTSNTHSINYSATCCELISRTAMFNSESGTVDNSLVNNQILTSYDPGKMESQSSSMF